MTSSRCRLAVWPAKALASAIFVEILKILICEGRKYKVKEMFGGGAISRKWAGGRDDSIKYLPLRVTQGSRFLLRCWLQTTDRKFYEHCVEYSDQILSYDSETRAMSTKKLRQNVLSHVMAVPNSLLPTFFPYFKASNRASADSILRFSFFSWILRCSSPGLRASKVLSRSLATNR